MLPSADQPGAEWARMVYVEFLPTRRKQEYPAAVPEQDWLETFMQDLAKDYYGKSVGPLFGGLEVEVPGS
jgi:hypothetical protein